MSLLSKLLPKKEATSYFLTLAVEERKIRAAIAQIKGSVVTLLGTGESTFAQGENETEAADMAISSAESQSLENLLVERVVFALPLFYLEGDNVKPEYLNRLKKITKDLNLKPNGFIEYPQALAFSIEREEGSPATAVLLHLEKTYCTFSLIRVGKIYKNIVIERSESIIDDFANTIPKFETEIMPSRIILFDHSEDLENIKSELLKFPWHKNSSFLHTPKVEILSAKDVIVALVEAAASSLLKNIDITIIKKEKDASPESSALVTKEEPISAKNEVSKGDVPVKKDEKETPHKGHLKIQGGVVHLVNDPTAEPLKEEKPDKLESNMDIKEKEVPEEKKGKETEPTVESKTQDAEETFGFVESSEIERLDEDGNITFTEKTEVVEEETLQDQKPHTGKNPLSLLNGILSSIKGKSLPSPSIPNIPGNIFIWLIPAFLILAGFLYYAVTIYPQASVSLIVYPFSINQTIPVVFKTSGNSPSDKTSIAVNSLTVEVNGEKTVATTGKNQIGEKGKGEVLIYNKTTSSKTFSKGTVLSSGDLRFSLDTDATVASASDTGEGLSFGKITARATAVSIGPDGNIAGGSLLKFKDFPDTSYTAKANQSFSGGTSREVASVSKADQTSLENSLTDELSGKAREELSQKLATGEKLLDAPPTKKVVSKKFSGEVGTEGKNLTLTLTLSLTGFSYQESDVITLAKENLTTIPSGYTLSDNSISIKTNTLTPDKDGNFKTDAKITATLFPQFDTTQILNKIAGASYADAESYLKTVEGVSGVAFTATRPSLLAPNHLPVTKKNISLSISTR